LRQGGEGSQTLKIQQSVPGDSEDAPPRRSRWTLRLGLVLIATLSTASVLLATEGAARLFGGFDDNVKRLDAAYRYDAVLGWAPTPGFSGDIEDIDRAFDARGVLRVDSTDLSTDTAPIYVLGASSTLGYRVPSESTYSELLERQIPGARTVNLAMPGYSSLQGALVLRKFAAVVPPAAVIAEFGIHDRVRGENYEIDSPEVFRRRHGGWAGSLQRRLMELHAYRAFRIGLIDIGLLPKPASCMYFEYLRPRVDLDQFRLNLRTIASTAQKSGAATIFVYLGASPESDATIQNATRLLNARDFKGAIRFLEPFVLTEDPRWSMHLLARRLLKAAYRGAGRSTTAIECVPMDDSGPLVPDTAYVRVMQEVAEETDAAFLDYSALPDRSSRDFLDDNHLSVEGHRHASYELAPMVAEALRRFVMK